MKNNDKLDLFITLILCVAIMFLVHEFMEGFFK